MSIAKACQMDGRAKGTCGAPACQQRGEAPDSSDSDFGKAVVRFIDVDYFKPTFITLV